MFVHRLKLRPPQLLPTWIERPLVQRRFGAAASVLSMVAGPGYGKTVLAAQVFAAWDGPKFWYSLDRADSDLAVFAAHLQSMLSAQRGITVPEGDAWRLGSAKELSRVFAEILADVRPNPLLVFDDVQLLRGSRSLTALGDFVERAARTGARFVLCGRSMPLSLHTLATGGQLVSAGAAELAFDKNEARAYLQRVAALAAGDPALERLASRSEGWPAGLALLGSAASVRAATAERGELAVSADESHELLFDYLATEVLDGLTERERQFLVETSILDALERETCDAVTGRHDAADLLPSLARRGLFINRRSEDAYTAHQLFREFLSDTLAREHAPEYIAGLHRRAAVSLDVRGDKVRAIAHALEAGDLDAAAATLETAAFEKLASGQLARVEEFLQRIGRERIDDNPTLLTALGRLQQYRGESDQAQGSLERAIAIAREREQYPVMAEAIRVLASTLAYHGEFERLRELLDEGLALGERAGRSGRTALAVALGALSIESGLLDEGLALCNEVLPDAVARGDFGMQGIVLHNMAVAHERRGDPYGALAAFERTLRVKRTAGQRSSALRTMASMIFVLRVLGDLDEAERVSRQLLDEAHDIGNAGMIAHAHENEGALKLLRGDVEGAARDFREAKNASDPSDVIVMPEIWYGFAQTSLALGDVGEAEDCCARSIALLRTPGRDQQIALVVLLRAECAVARGEFESAFARVKEALALAEGANAVMTVWVLLEAAALLVRIASSLPAEQNVEAERAGAAAATSAIALIHQRDYRFMLRTKAHVFAELHPHLLRWQIGQGLMPDAPRTEKSLRIELLGGLRIVVAGEPLPAEAWKRRKARDIFAYLVSLRGRAVPRARLIDLYWPDTDADAAHDNLRVTISAIRKALGDVVKYEANGYRFAAPADTTIDAEQFDAHMESARQAGAAGVLEGVRHAYMAAIDLYRGEFLEGIDDGGWQWRERERLRAAFLEALRWLASDTQGDIAVRRIALARILEVAPFDVEAVRMHLEFLVIEARVGDARRDYEIWKRRYRSAVGADPPEIWRPPDALSTPATVRKLLQRQS